MITTLAILITLLFADFGAQQTPQLSLDLTEAQTCVAEFLPCSSNLSHHDAHTLLNSQPNT